MHCPEHLVIGSRWLYVWMYWRDVPRERIPLRIWLNPLRYEVMLGAAGRRLVINRYGGWAVRLPYFFRRMKCKAFGHKPEEIGRTSFCERCSKMLGVRHD